ncbi:hypothetical protein WDU94_001930, partial [Cyamophila willieti]
VVEAIKKGKSQIEVAKLFNLSKQIVSVWMKVYNKQGCMMNQKRSGRPRKTTPNTDRIIKRMSMKDPRLTAPAINAHLKKNLKINVDDSTVRRRLQEVGLHGRRPSKKPLISTKNKKARLEFAKKHVTWEDADWSKVLFSDESKFNLLSSDGIKFVRRPVNERDNVKYQVPTVKHGGGSVMVWGCFSRSGVGPLVKIDGIMDRFGYEKILRDHMLPHAHSKMPPTWIFQQDNDPKHKSKHIQGMMKSSQINCLEWPSQSADLNPIEHLWEELDRRVRGRQYSNQEQFYEVLKEEWNNIPLSVLHKLVDSMRRRCEAVIKAKGFATKY